MSIDASQAPPSVARTLVVSAVTLALAGGLGAIVVRAAEAIGEGGWALGLLAAGAGVLTTLVFVLSKAPRRRKPVEELSRQELIALVLRVLEENGIVEEAFAQQEGEDAADDIALLDAALEEDETQ